MEGALVAQRRSVARLISEGSQLLPLCQRPAQQARCVREEWLDGAHPAILLQEEPVWSLFHCSASRYDRLNSHTDLSGVLEDAANIPKSPCGDCSHRSGAFISDKFLKQWPQPSWQHCSMNWIAMVQRNQTCTFLPICCAVNKNRRKSYRCKRDFRIQCRGCAHGKQRNLCCTEEPPGLLREP